jgi:hypothetical protein
LGSWKWWDQIVEDIIALSITLDGEKVYAFGLDAHIEIPAVAPNSLRL